MSTQNKEEMLDYYFDYFALWYRDLFAKNRKNMLMFPHQKGGWEGWLQVEIGSYVYHSFKHVRSEREAPIYEESQNATTDLLIIPQKDNSSDDITMDDDSEDTEYDLDDLKNSFIFEFKTKMESDSIPKFVSKIREDIIKLSGQKIKSEYANAVRIAMGFFVNTNINEFNKEMRKCVKEFDLDDNYRLLPLDGAGFAMIVCYIPHDILPQM